MSCVAGWLTGFQTPLLVHSIALRDGIREKVAFWWVLPINAALGVLLYGFGSVYVSQEILLCFEDQILQQFSKLSTFGPPPCLFFGAASGVLAAVVSYAMWRLAVKRVWV